MFDPNVDLSGIEKFLQYKPEPVVKRAKLNHPSNNSKRIHSSLSHSSIKAPPLVEYKSINEYCEIRSGISNSLCTEKNVPPSISGINNLQSISSPIIFKSPGRLAVKKPLPSDAHMPYSFFSIEELSLVKCLENWTNTKVCPVGMIDYSHDTQQYYLHSILEKCSWKLLLDTTFLTDIPSPQIILQMFGIIQVNKGVPTLKVHFYKDLGSVDLPLFLESYKLMQKYMPQFINHVEPVDESGKTNEVNGSFLHNTTRTGSMSTGMDLNDTLDDYDFSLIM